MKVEYRGECGPICVTRTSCPLPPADGDEQCYTRCACNPKPGCVQVCPPVEPCVNGGFCGATSTATCVSDEGDAGCIRECECVGMFARCLLRCGGEPFTCPGHSRFDGGCGEPTQCSPEGPCSDSPCSCGGSGGWLCNPCYSVRASGA